MSNTESNNSKLELEVQNYTIDNSDKIYNDLQEKYVELDRENTILAEENRLLKDIIIKNNKKKFEKSLVNEKFLKSKNESKKSSLSFYIQIILGIFIIILSLGFHILYLAITSCLIYSDGKSNCWIVSWLGMDLHASFYIDVVLYSLIAIQVIIIILIIREKIQKK
ncbi:MAG: hypothetical protein ACFFDH_03670 [Promethearchaeota archaeon]